MPPSLKKTLYITYVITSIPEFKKSYGKYLFLGIFMQKLFHLRVYNYYKRKFINFSVMSIKFLYGEFPVLILIGYCCAVRARRSGWTRTFATARQTAASPSTTHPSARAKTLRYVYSKSTDSRVHNPFQVIHTVFFSFRSVSLYIYSFVL